MAEAAPDTGSGAAAGAPIPDAGTGVETTIRGSGMPFRECVDRINKSLDHPKVRFLREHMLKAGCPVWVQLLMPLNCNSEGLSYAGGYARGKGISVCCNHMTFQDEINQVLIHELIHAYDDCRAKNITWSNCAHHACSEIRANHLSGDCHYKRELLRGYTKLRGHEQECVKRRALKSLQLNPNCSGAAAKDAIEAVWDICYNDTYPFERAP
ncbi:mitochondrial inner membrane protease ATP23-like [Zingiber officinale]|nr:mitochondrial inner membrane protease ATP23-like [Zingiber officinale]